MEPPVIEGERLTLRPLTDEDVEILLPAIYEPGTVEWWGDTSDPDYQREGLRNEGNEGNAFAIVIGDEVAGWLCFEEEPEPDYREVAFDILLCPAFQHQGLGADALRTLIRWFIDVRGHWRDSLLMDLLAEEWASAQCRRSSQGRFQLAQRSRAGLVRSGVVGAGGQPHGSHGR